MRHISAIAIVAVGLICAGCSSENTDQQEQPTPKAVPISIEDEVRYVDTWYKPLNDTFCEDFTNEMNDGQRWASMATFLSDTRGKRPLPSTVDSFTPKVLDECNSDPMQMVNDVASKVYRGSPKYFTGDYAS